MTQKETVSYLNAKDRTFSFKAKPHYKIPINKILDQLCKTAKNIAGLSLIIDILYIYDKAYILYIPCVIKKGKKVHIIETDR